MTNVERRDCADNSDELIFFSLRADKPDATDAQVQTALAELSKYKSIPPAQMANNFFALNGIYTKLIESGFFRNINMNIS